MSILFLHFMEIIQIKPSNFDYSKDLQHIPDTPKQLFVRGKLPLKRIKSIAIVGTRKPSTYGREIATKIATECAQNGIVVVSGLALGIDSIAHRATLDAGGITIAVLANGVDKIYPRSHEALGQRILQNNGAIISEYPNGTPAQPWQFLARNRIISGLADAVVVVEAASRSGTLSTANHALDQGKEVFAVPGNINSPLSAGCNQLIKNGANPLTSVEDLLDFLIPDRFENHTPEIFVIKISEISEIKTDGNFIAKLLNPKISMLIFCKNLKGKSIIFLEKIFEKFRLAAFLVLSISPAVRPLGAKNKV